MKKRKIIIRLIVGFLILILSSSAGVYFGIILPSFDKLNSETPSDILDTPVNENKDKSFSFNILLIGVDRSKSLTDVIMLASVNKDSKTINLSSIPRDTRVKSNNRFKKINSLYGKGGISVLIETVKELTGAPIHYYAIVDFEGFRNIVDILGGVEFDVPQRMKYRDPAQNLNIDLKPGLQVLDGEKAEQLVRYRQYVEGDVQRTRVQQNFLKALFEQKCNSSYLLKVPELFGEISKSCKTNVTLGMILDNLNLFNSLDEYEFNVHDMPGEGAYVNKVSYFLPDYKKAYELFATHFMGNGEPEVKNYTDLTGAKWPEGWNN